MTIGQRMKERRLALGMSADDLAAKLGKNRSTIFRYENGDIENLPLDMLKPIATALSITPQELMGWETDEKEEENIKNSDAIAGITKRLFEDSEFFNVVDYLYKLNDKNFERAIKLLHYFFEESFDVDKN